MPFVSSLGKKKRDQFGNLVSAIGTQENVLNRYGRGDAVDQALGTLDKGAAAAGDFIAPGIKFAEPLLSKLGFLNTIGGFTAAVGHNSVAADTAAQVAGESPVFGGRSLARLFGMGGPQLLLDQFTAPDAVNPFAEAANAFQGKQYAGITEAIKEHMAPAAEQLYGADSAQARILGDEVVQFGLGAAAEAAMDPTTGIGNGLSFGSKAEKVAKLGQMADTVYDSAKLADLGITSAQVAKHGAEYTKMAGKGADLGADVARGLRRAELPPGLAQEVDSAVGLLAGAEQAGKPRTIGLPFARKATETGGTAGFHATTPTLQAVAPERLAAIRNAVADGTDSTFLSRFIAKNGIEPTVRGWGATGERIKFNVGTKVADKGGIKLYGQTVLDVQPQIDKAVWEAKKFARGTKPGKWADKAFSRYADIAQSNNPLMIAAAKAADREYLMLGRGLAKVDAIESSMPAMKDLTREEAMTMGADVEKVLSPEARAKLPVLNATVAKVESGKLADKAMHTGWIPGARSQIEDEAKAIMGAERSLPRAPDLIDHFKESLAGRRISDNARLTVEDALAVKQGGKVPIRAEVKAYADAGLPVVGVKNRFAGQAMDEEKVLVSLHNAYPGYYDHLETPDDLWNAVDRARTMRDKAAFAGGKSATKAGGALNETTLRLAANDPTAIEDVLTRRMVEASKAQDAEGAARAYADLQEFDQWNAAQATVAKGAARADATTAKAAEQFIGPVKVTPAPEVGKVGAFGEITGGADVPLPPQAKRLELLNAQIHDLLSTADIDNLTREWLAAGRDPERVAVMRDYLVKHTADMEAVQAAEQAAGVAGKYHLGEQAGSTGYMYQTDPARPTPRESVMNLFGKRTEAQKVRDQVLTERGFDPASLSRIERTRRGEVIATHTGEAYERTMPFLSDRLKAGIDTELDIRIADAARKQKSGSRIAVAAFEDKQFADYGTELGRYRNAGEASKRAQPLAGEVVRTATRNGETVAYSIDANVSRWMDSLDMLYSSDEATKGFWGGYRRIQNTFKRWATSANLGFHGRNMFSNYFLSWTVDRAQPKGWIDAMDIMSAADTPRGATQKFTFGGLTKTADEWMTDTLERGVRKEFFGPEEVSTLLPRELARREKVAAFKQGLAEGDVRKVGSNISALHPVSLGSDFGTRVEDSGRMAVYFNSLEAGMAPEAAMLLPDVALYNYSQESLTSFQKDVVKTAVPFGTWAMKNIPHMMEFALKSPGKAGLIEKIKNSAFSATGVERGSLPLYMQEMGAMPVPGLRDSAGNPIILNPNIPLQDLQKLPANPVEAIDWIAGQVGPAAKYAGEAAFKRDSFTGADIYQGDRVKVLGGALDPLNAALDQIAPTPWSALKSAVGGATQYDTTTGESYLAGNEYANRAATGINPWLANLGKAAGGVGDPGNEYKWLSWLGGIKLMPADKQKFIIEALYRARDELDRQRRGLDAETQGGSAATKTPKKKKMF